MSYTQFVATASCSVVDDFNLQSYLNGLSKRCVNEKNFIFDYGVNSNGDLYVNFNHYVRQIENKILIECDTEEMNGNSEVWDWIIDRFLCVMTSQLMTIKSATIDSRSGVDIDICFYDKDANCFYVDKLIEDYKNTLSQP